MSIDPTNANYFARVLGVDPGTRQDGYAYVTFPSSQAFITGALVGSGSMSLALATGELNFSSSVWGNWSNANTPLFRSQLVGGIRYNLFQFFTKGDGSAENMDVKISIANIKPGVLPTDWGTFSV
jgi:hypothetical protein